MDFASTQSIYLGWHFRSVILLTMRSRMREGGNKLDREGGIHPPVRFSELCGLWSAVH